MRTAAATLSTLVLAATFAWASIAKLMAWRRWRSTLRRYGLGRAQEHAAAVGVPAAEALVVALFLAVSARAAAALALALMSAFSLAVVRARALQGDELPCGCFGRAAKRDYREILVRNALLGALAAVALVAGDRARTLQLPGSQEVLPAALAVTGMVLVGVVAWQAGGALKKRT
jgi:hypothetical protein